MSWDIMWSLLGFEEGFEEGKRGEEREEGGAAAAEYDIVTLISVMKVLCERYESRYGLDSQRSARTSDAAVLGTSLSTEGLP